MANATRPATEQEITEFRTAAQLAEHGRCLTLELAAASGSCLPSRSDYEPVVTEERVSTMDETWATAYVAPALHLAEAATVVLRKRNGPTDRRRRFWSAQLLVGDYVWKRL
jgi:hypothetical protein